MAFDGNNEEMEENGRKRKKNSLIQVPNELIDNSEVDTNTTMIYVHLKSKSFNGECNIFIGKIVDDLGVSKDTVKRKLKLLKKMDLVDYTIVRSKPIVISFNKVEDFTQIGRDAINYIIENNKEVSVTNNTTGEIKDINLISQTLRLYYYYEKLYNVDYGYAYPTLKTSSKQCKMSDKTVNTINSLLEKDELLRIERGKHHKLESGQIKKENNKYSPLWLRVRQIYQSGQ